MKPIAIDAHKQRNSWKHQGCDCVIYIHTNQFDYETSLCYLQVKYYEPTKNFYRFNKIKKTNWVYALVLALCLGPNSCL